MSITKEEFKNEEAYLEKVTSVFDVNFEEEIKAFSNIAERVAELKRYFADNKTSMDPGEINQTMQTISELVDSGNLVNKKHNLLKRVYNAPYFGRFDFDDYHYKELINVYVGLTSISERGADKYLVYDWRSPVSSMYYEEGVGEASYEAPIGTISGNITLKRQYKIEKRKLEYVFDSNINIDDELLREALVKSTSAKMKTIVNSIQKEQNQVIRNNTDEVLIIDGPAGSGKTSVALHRIAFLLYRDRDYLRASNVVILSPNPVFSEYISRVLPELGEENVEYISFSEYYVDNIKNRTQAVSFSNYIKGIYEAKTALEKDVNNFRSSTTFKNMLDDYLLKLEASVVFKDITFKGKIGLTKQEFEEFFNKQYKKFKLEQRMQYLIDKATLQVYENLSIYERTQIKKSQIRIVIARQLKFEFDVETLYKRLFKDINFVNDYVKKLKLKTPTKELCNYIIGGLDEKTLAYDDLIALTYLKLKLSGIRQDDTVKHLIIDEAQDYSLLQYEIIKGTFKDAEFTIVGDVNQAINPYLKYENFARLSKIFKERKTKHFSLLNCYRNSYEISNFSNALLGLNNIKAINRYGGLPTIYAGMKKAEVISGIVQKVKEMRDAGLKQIGIITKTTLGAKSLYNELNTQIEELNHIDFASSHYSDGVSVLSSYVSKGLEFDAVIAANFEGDYTNNGEMHLLYVVFTRALHQLIIFNESQDLGLLSNIPNNLYKLSNIIKNS